MTELTACPFSLLAGRMWLAGRMRGEAGAEIAEKPPQHLTYARHFSRRERELVASAFDPYATALPPGRADEGNKASRHAQ